MKIVGSAKLVIVLAVLVAAGLSGCRGHMPHALTWPATGDITPTHAKPPEGGYYKNWDPYAVGLEVKPVRDVNPVQTQHVLVATVTDKNGKPLPNRRVEWMIAEGSVGDIVEVDESGWRASRGYKVDNHYAVSHTNNFAHVLDMGNDDPADDIQLQKGDTWCVITSPIEGDTHVTVYAPGIYNWDKHKVFVTKHWYDVKWEFPPPATNPMGTTHELVTLVMKHSDGTPLAGYIVNYRIVDGPAATLEPGGRQAATVKTDDAGAAAVVLKQTKPAQGTNNIAIEVIRPADEQCCKPAAHIASGRTSKTWVGPKIAITKKAPAQESVDRPFAYSIVVTNPSQVAATNVVVSDTLPEGIEYISCSPAPEVSGQSLTWSLGTLPAQASKPIVVRVKATHAGKFENCAAVRADEGLTARDCATTVVIAPKLTLEKQCPEEVLICDPIEYTIVVRNTGAGPATNVRVSDELPEGLVTTDGKTSVAVNLGTLEQGQMRQIRFSAQARKTGKYENTANATADGGLKAEDTCTTIVRQPKLSVSKTGPELRYVDRPAAYEIVVSNEGDGPARDTILVDEVPAGTEFVSASHNGRFDNGKVTWQMGTLAPRTSRTVTLTIKPIKRGVVRNTASATAYCAEASDSATTQVQGIPAILLEVVDVEDPVEVGSNVTYVIVVTNQGSADGTNIVIECTLPPEGQYVSSEGLPSVTAEGKTVKFAPLPTLAPKARATYHVVMRGTAAADVRFKVRLTSDQMDSPVEETESTHFYK